jgi:16S rRNA (guanine966-N2)-methyltransferase
MKYQVRIIAGDLRGRKIEVKHDPGLRPMSDRARGALFNILVNDIPDRPFYDIFAGSGAVGLEALSRGASQAIFVEKDGLAVQAILAHGKKFQVAERVRVLQVDAYRWVDKGAIPSEPANYFVGPPYRDLEEKRDAILWLITVLQQRIAAESVIALQTDDNYDAGQLPESEHWDVRRYGRNQIALWTHPTASATYTGDDAGLRA